MVRPGRGTGWTAPEQVEHTKKRVGVGIEETTQPLYIPTGVLELCQEVPNFLIPAVQGAATSDEMNNDVSIKAEISVASHDMMHQHPRNPSAAKIHIRAPNIGINVLVAELGPGCLGTHTSCKTS